MKPITTEDAVPLFGLLSCFAAAAADAAADSSAVEKAAAIIAACGLSYCSPAAADGATDAAADSANSQLCLTPGRRFQKSCCFTMKIVKRQLPLCP